MTCVTYCVNGDALGAPTSSWNDMDQSKCHKNDDVMPFPCQAVC